MPKTFHYLNKKSINYDFQIISISFQILEINHLPNEYLSLKKNKS